DLINHKYIGNQHATGNPTQQACTERHDHREAIDEFQDQCTAPNNNGHTNNQTKNHVVDLMVGMRVLRSTGNRNNVIQAHDQVGNENRLYGSPNRRGTAHIPMFVFFGKKKFDADPEQQQGANDFKERNIKQHERKCNEHDPQADRAGGTPKNALHALFGRKIATSQSNNDRVVSAQQDVDQNDLENGPPVEGLKKFNHRCFRYAERRLIDS